MRITNRQFLFFITLVSLATIPLVWLTAGVVRTVFVLVSAGFVPGYLLMSALFPRRSHPILIARIALSFVASMIVVAGLGLVTNFITSGITLKTLFYTVEGFCLVLFVIALIRDHRLPETERISCRLDLKKAGPSGLPRQDRILYGVAAVLLAAVLVSLIWVAFVPNREEKYCEFYLLDGSAQSVDLPRTALVDEPVSFTTGIVSHADIPEEYRIVVYIENQAVTEMVTGLLAPEEKWEQPVNLPPFDEPGRKRVELFLYPVGETQPCYPDPLFFEISVLPGKVNE